MKYGITATTRPDSMWGRTARWRCDRWPPSGFRFRSGSPGRLVLSMTSGGRLTTSTTMPPHRWNRRRNHCGRWKCKIDNGESL